MLLIGALLAAPVSCKKPLPEPPVIEEPDPDPDPEPEPEPDPDPTPDPEPDPLPATLDMTQAKWEISSDRASAGSASWINNNKFFAHEGKLANKAYFSTSAAEGNKGPVRMLNGNYVSAANFAPGDAFEFTLPVAALAAGSTVDFMVTLYTPTSASPKYWLFEYFDDGQWKYVEEDTKTIGGERYSFYIKYYSSALYTTFVQSFTTTKDIKDGELKMRCKVVGNQNNGGGTLSPSNTAYVGFVNSYYRSCYINSYQGIPVKDTKKVLVLGNSFTYYYGASFLLKEIARSQGHEIRMRASIKGSQYFRNHSSLEISQDLVKEGGYDYAILQDQSGQHARYYADPKTNAAVLTETQTLVNQIKSFSSNVQPVVENTWAFLGSANYEGYGDFATFDKALQGGAILVCAGSNAWESPVGVAFEKARAAGITNLYHTDNKHPNRNGAYLKACVNYLLLYGERFDANAPDCLVDATTAKKLRDIAESVVFDNTDQWKHPDASKVTPGEGLEPVTGGAEIDPDSIVWGENGIKTADQLISYAMLANAGGYDLSSYQNEAGEVELLADIDLAGKTWTAIGVAPATTAYNSAPVPQNAFQGTFNGGGHTIKNLTVNIPDNQTTFNGFFGATKNAVIKDLTLEGVKSDFTSTGISSNNVVLGSLAAYCYNTKISNVNVSAAFTGKATSTATRNVCIGGLVGQITSAGSDYASSIENCTFSGTMTNDVGAKYSNNNTVMIGGVVGGVPNVSGSKLVKIKNCTNNGKLDVKTHRAAGIVANVFYADIDSCTNKGDITASFSSSCPTLSITGTRTGGVMAYSSFTSTSTSIIQNCENHATITSMQSGSYVGGVIGLIRCFNVSNCRNYGNVICVDATRGLLVGQITNATNPSVFTNCSLKGSIGSSESSLTAATAENYLQLGAGIASDAPTPSWNADNIHFLQ